MLLPMLQLALPAAVAHHPAPAAASAVQPPLAAAPHVGAQRVGTGTHGQCPGNDQGFLPLLQLLLLLLLIISFTVHLGRKRSRMQQQGKHPPLHGAFPKPPGLDLGCAGIPHLSRALLQRLKVVLAATSSLEA